MSTRTSQRPDSRASTTSAKSQGNESFPSMAQDIKSAQNTYLAQGPEAALLHYQASMAPQQNPQYESMPPQHIGPHTSQSVYQLQPAIAMHDMSYMQQDMGMGHQVRMGSVPIATVMDMADDKRRKGSAVTATNDKELREMLAKNEGRPLRDVAQEVIQKERTPMAEKTKQLFAMLWLRAVCRPAKTSVPRNRVYSQYATRCGTERVVPLNPASFGKLVRVIFPGIQTRRLGVRGESKYHYVDLALEEESPHSMSMTWQNASMFHSTDARRRSQSVSTQQIDFNNIPRLEADTSVFMSADRTFDIASPHPPTPRGPPSKGQTFVYPEVRGLTAGAPESTSYTHTLRFPPSNLPTFTENEPVNLPSLQPYLPPRTDLDTAEALSALYRTHCTSLIDSIRFCKEKQFFRLYTSFQGTLTVPVQKLFTHPNLAPWIEQCDLVMYRTMVRFVSRLTLQAAPVVVINILSNISASLHNHIAKTFAALPPYVLGAKLKPATVFARLLYRLIRVNQSAHAAANLLTIDQNREQMWHEWVNMVNPKRVMETELPDCGYEEVYKIMTTEMRSLLEPLQAPAFPDEHPSVNFFNLDAEHGSFAQYMQNQTALPTSNGPSQVSTENVLDRWSAFLTSVPGRFPRASARTILHCISAVGTAALRDITIMSGLSYGHWWVLKIFVDEMALWMAEMGGFLEPAQEPASPSPDRAYQSDAMENVSRRSNSGSRMSSAAPGGGSGIGSLGEQSHSMAFPSEPHSQSFANGTHMQSHSQQTHVQSHPASQQAPSYHHHMSSSQTPQQHGLPFHIPQDQHAQDLKSQQQNLDHDIDDSGIGLSMMDDDLALSKYSGSGQHLGMEPVTTAST